MNLYNMDRRIFLQTSTFLGSTLFFPGIGLTIPSTILSDGIYQFQIGKFNCYSISDGIFPHASLDFLFSGAPKDLLAQKAREYNLPPSNIEIPLNFLLVETGNELILVDTGYGNMAKERKDPAGMLLTKLGDLEVDIEKIKKVIITHQHPDHLGGVSSKDGQILFPNATFYMDRNEYNSLKDATGWAIEKLRNIESKLIMIEGKQKIAKGITVQKAYGHTPGHIHLLIKSKGQKILYTSDTFGHELHLAYPGWSMGHEYSKEIAAKARREVLERAVRKNLTLFSCHLPFPGIGTVEKDGEGYKWIPVS